MNSQKLWTKNYIILMFTSFFISLTFYLLMTTMAAYAIERFQASESWAGLASSIFILAAVFSRLVIGKYLELIGRRKVLLTSLIVFFIACLLYLPTNSLYLLLAVRFLHGAAFGSATTAVTTAVMSLIPDSRRGEGTSYFSLSSSAGTAIGPFLGLYIAQHADHQMIFYTCTAFAVLGIIATLFAQVPEAELTSEQRQQMRQGFRLGDFFEKRALPISLIMILMGIGYSSIVSFINTYAADIQLTDVASYFFSVYAVTLFLSRPFTGKLLDAKGDNIVIYPAIALFAVCLLLLSVTEHGFTFLLSGALAALGFGTIMSAGQAIAIKVTPPHRYGLATSTFFICLDGGMGIGPFILGLLIPLVGYKGMYLTIAIIVAAALGLYHVLHGKKAAIARRQLTTAAPMSTEHHTQSV